MQIHTEQLDWGNGNVLTVETGRLARQADGSVVIRQGDLVMLATVVANKEIDPTRDFLPLSVDYLEKYASTGKIPGGFFKRDGRPNEFEILTSRIVDRSIRPMFPDKFYTDIQVLIYVYSSDKENKGDSLACVAASCALMASDIPFPEPVSTVRVARINGEFVINPTVTALEEADLDLIVAGTADSVVMVEGEMKEVPESVMVEALKEAHVWIKQLCELQERLRGKVAKPTREWEAPVENEDYKARVKQECEAALREIVASPSEKHERSDAFKALKDELKEKLIAENPELEEDEQTLKQISEFFGKLKKQVTREHYLKAKQRLDGRKFDEIRDIWCDTSYLPRAHGSALFTRGETQSIATVTLGTKLDEQMIDYATVQGFKSFMLQYTFPPFSTGEAKFLRGPARREVGHGNLAERALKNLVPEQNEYTIRVTSDILESNGSSSMASVCAGSMALMDAGVQIHKSCSGIAMGLIMDVESGEYAVLSDILGDEDHLGDMDFKVTGTKDGLTACQMDIKVKGLSFEILTQALEQSRAGRLHILGKMDEAIAAPKDDISPYAPRLLKLTIPQSKIGAVIGSGGKVIQEIQRETNTQISIDEIDNQGHVVIASSDKDDIMKARDWVLGIVEEPEVGAVVNATVKIMKDIGAVMEFGYGKEGFMHISQVTYEHLDKMEDAVKVGDIMEVKVTEVDERTGRIRLSRKAMLPKPEGYVERERPPRSNNGRGGGGRGGNRDRKR